MTLEIDVVSLSVQGELLKEARARVTGALTSKRSLQELDPNSVLGVLGAAHGWLVSWLVGCLVGSMVGWLTYGMDSPDSWRLHGDFVAYRSCFPPISLGYTRAG